MHTYSAQTEKIKTNIIICKAAKQKISNSIFKISPFPSPKMPPGNNPNRSNQMELLSFHFHVLLRTTQISWKLHSGRTVEQDRFVTSLRGPFKSYMRFFLEIGHPHPLVTLTTLGHAYTSVMLICTNPYTPHPHCVT